jgi:SAM-dependent methyltransferase
MATRNNLHTSSGLSTYIRGMLNSSNDKDKINDFLVPGSLLELGCGSGAYLKTIGPEILAQTTGVDMNAMLLLRAKEELEAHFGEEAAEVEFIRANAMDSNLSSVLRHRQFNNIVLCSFLHEMYSEFYHIGRQMNQDHDNDSYAKTRIQTLLDNIWDLLAPGGRLIIRDGCKPKSVTATIKFKNDVVRKAFAKFVDDYPWFINYIEINGVVELKLDDAFEFLTKYFYTENWDVEVQEKFGWCTPYEMDELLGKKSFNVVSSMSYCIPWLKNKWAKDFEISTITDKTFVPDSTMLLAYEKR